MGQSASQLCPKDTILFFRIEGSRYFSFCCLNLQYSTFLEAEYCVSLLLYLPVANSFDIRARFTEAAR